MRRRHALLWLAALAGCARARPAVVPMPALRIAAACPARTLLVLLPGVYSLPQEFVDEGFVDALRTRGIAADVAAVDSHLGYFADRSVLDRLRSDIVLPARAAGYGSIWFVGISLGGFAALGYALQHPGDIDGVLALAPYLGERELLREIGNGGGARAWAAAAAPATPEQPDRAIWQRFAHDPPRLPVYLGWGGSDRFADAERAFATLLPDGRSSTADGGHDWPAWRALWAGWLDRGLLPAGCERRGQQTAHGR